MAYSTRTIGIAVASVIAVVLIAFAVVLSGPLPFHLTKVDAESTHDLLVSYAAKDSDNDGLPDWEEALYGTDPNNPHSVSAALTDGQAVAQGLVKPKFASATSTAPVNPSTVPGVAVATTTVTDQFARTLFSQYLLSRGSTPPTQQDIVNFVQQGIAQLEQNQTVPPAFNVGEVRVVGSGSAALTAYAAAAENAFTKRSVATTKSEIDLYSDAVTKNDATALAQVNSIARTYIATAHDLIALPVPREAADAHLQLANALDQMGQVLTDMGTLNTDPLRAMLGIRKYDAAHAKLVTAFAAMQKVYASSGVSLTAGPGSRFVSALNAAVASAPTQ